MSIRILSRFISSLLALSAAVALTATVRAQTILPDATAGTAYQFQITTSPPPPSGTTYAADGLPSGLAVDAASGVIAGTTTAVGTFNGNLTLSSGGTSNRYPYQLTVDPAANTPVITSPGSAVGTVGAPFTYTVAATNAPSSWNIAELPPGLTANGPVISGTPTSAGQFFTSVSGNNASGQGKILVIMWTINPAGPVPVVTSALLGSAEPNAAFSYQITATNAPTSFSASGLPPGLRLDSASGLISGTPTGTGISTVSLSATNSYGPSKAVNLTLTVGDYAAITSAPALAANVGVAYNYTLTATNSPYSFSLTGLPSGLVYNDVTGVVSGTPTTAGTYTLTARATNALGAGAPANLTLTVANSATGSGGNLTAPYILVNPLSQTATVGSNVTLSVTAVGSGTLRYQWSLNGNPISGASAASLPLSELTAAQAGTYSVAVTNDIGSTTSADAILTVSSVLVPPAITGQPVKTTVSVGTNATFTVVAAGSAPLTYQWMVNGQPIAGANAATLLVPLVKQSDAGTYTVVVTNLQGTKTSDPASLTVSATPIAPIFQFQPTDTTVAAGGTASLSVGVVGSSPISYQWYKGGAAVPGAVGPALTLTGVKAADAGTYSVVITNPGGTVTSTNAKLAVSTAGGAPVPVTIALQPAPVSTTIGSSVTLTVAVTGDPAVTYQWRKNQGAIAGATKASFTISNVQNADAGTYDVIVANGFSATISFPTAVTVTPVAVPSQLINVSVRAITGSGPQALTAGFVIAGTGTKSALVRAVGPSLASYGVPNPLADPQLTVYAPGATPMASNDNWGGGSGLSAAFSQVGAFALPTTSLDAALTSNFQPGLYTAVVQGAAGTSGVALLEVYDADAAVTPTARFTNLSIRGQAGTGANVLTVGFVVGGTTGKTLLIRGVGPGLIPFGVVGALADPQLTVFDSTDTPIASNASWGGSASLAAAGKSVYAFDLVPGSADSALLLTVGPGVYTAQVTSASGASGIALLEIYEVQ